MMSQLSPASASLISSNNAAASQPLHDIGGTPQSPVVALNLATNTSTAPTMPLAFQVPGIGNSQQPVMANGNTPVQAPTLQANNGGGSIIVFNVGNGNNLAAAISQLVSGGLIQQPHAQVPIVNASSPGLSETQTSTSSTVTQGSTTETSLTTIVPTMSSHSISTIDPQMTIPQSNMANSKHMPLSVPTQQTQSQQPAAFMLVPIPQLPAVQNQQTNFVTGTGHQQQQQVMVTVPNQIAHAYPHQDRIANHHHEPAMHPTAHASAPVHTPPPSQVQSALPKTDELRAFLTESSNSNLVTEAASQIRTSSNFYPSHSIVPGQKTSAHSQLHCSVPGDLINHVALSRCQPTVSSPGLAFLAQVSTLTSPNQNGTMVTTDTNSTATDSSPVFHPSYHDLTGPEVNNNSLPAHSLDNVKEGAPVSEGRTMHRSPMTVSSTTKLGDDGARELIMEQQTSSQTTDMVIHEIRERSDFCFQGAKEKRKKDPPFPVPVKEKKKKGPAPKLVGNEVCLICGDRASGFHYNTLSCEGCKGFFRRTVIKAAKYQCKQKGDCTMDLYMRRKCQKCRFEKCKAVGMREESVLSEEKVKAKRLKKECEAAISPVKGLLDNVPCPKLTPQQRSLIELLEANERRFQWPTIDDMKKVTVWVEGDDTPHSRALRFAHFTELCILIVQLVVEFTKQLPGFLSVLREDQIVLLKACAIEVMLLRAAKQYNKHDGTINFLNGKLYDKSSFYRAGMQVEFVDPIFQFCNSMAQLDLDDTEYAILVAINTFSTDRPHIKDIEKVECMQDPYVDLLRIYSRIRHPDDPLMFARILMKIVELRTLNNYHSEQIFALKVQDKKLPPLLAEIWDM